jgi:anti-sigma factor RsiW
MSDEPMSVAEIEELLGAYALDAVDPDERRVVEAHLADCPKCRAELAGHLEVASWMAGGGAPAPDRVWERISSSLDGPVPEMRLTSDDLAAARAHHRPDVLPGSGPAGAPGAPATVVPIAGRRSRRAVGVLAAAVAVAASVVLVLGVVVARQASTIDDQRDEIALPMLSRAAGEAMADPSATKVNLTAPDGGGAAATVVVTADGTGYLLDTALEPLPTDRTYQLWGIDGDRVISLGLMGSDPVVVAFPAGGATFTTFAVTEEVAGGVPQSENRPVVVGTV